MKIRFWGVRGSCPRPMAPDAIRNKIVSVVRRIRPEHIETEESKKAFLLGLPDWLYGTVGGNTPCLELECDAGKSIIFDSGTGIIPYGNSLSKLNSPPKEFHIFFTHFHYDHIQGLPLFGPAYDPTVQITFYSPIPSFEKILRDHMQHPFFPITMDGKMTSNIHFKTLDGEGFDLFGSRVSWRKLNHPGVAYGYRVEKDERTFAYVSDVELMTSDFERNDENKKFFSDVHTMVLDTPYTLGEAIEKYNWGHSSFTHGVEFAHNWDTDILFLFHHEPRYDDQRLQLNLQSARWYMRSLGNRKLRIYLASEGCEQEI